MRESRTYGSVRGALSNERPYRDISHSSEDAAAAIKVRDWLKHNGWAEIYLDLDPLRGNAPGQHWEENLKHFVERCSGMLVLISPGWIESRWCQAEFLAAKLMGKKIFPLFVAPTPFDAVPIELKATFQIADISVPEKEAEGLERLAIGLKRAGLDPGSFEWPPPGDPHRPIYRGLQSLDELDAAIFFGRDSLITEGLDALRRMRGGGDKRMLVILGASGAGKSSFLKAGLIARLKRDRHNFLVLPVVRPERAALTGAHGLAFSLSSDPARLNTPEDIVDALAKLRAPVIQELKQFARGTGDSYTARLPTVVIAIDQAEELFAAENVEAAQVLDLLAGAVRLDANTIIIATIRSDSFEKLQGEPRLCDVSRLPFDLPQISHGTFKDVIEGPARISNPPLTIEPALTDTLLNDLAADDALPLLAFTLEKLSLLHRGGGVLTRAEYVEELGGLRGAITGAVEAAFAAAQRDPALPQERVELERLARATFVPALVQLDDADAEPRRRVESLNALPEATLPLVRHLIDQRLLVIDRSTIGGIEIDTVEVAHEAILRQWRTLRGWIAEERDALRTLDGVRTAAADWHAHQDPADPEPGNSWLTQQSGRLEEAEALMTRPGFVKALSAGEREYLSACRASENAERLREKRGIARTRRLQRSIGIVIAAAAVVVVLAALGIATLLAGTAARTSVALASLAGKEAGTGNYDAAVRYALVGLAGADWPLLGYPGTEARAELVGDASASRAMAVLRGHDHGVFSAAYSPDGSRIVTASWDNTARIWDARTTRVIAILRGHTAAVVDAAYNPDGTRIVTAAWDNTARIWDAGTAHQIAVLRGHGGLVESAAYSPDGTRIVTASDDRTARVWDATTARQLAVLRGHNGPVHSAAYSLDSPHIVTASNDTTARIWDAGTGQEIAVLRGHTDKVRKAAYSPDGTRIVTASYDKTARIWDARTALPIAVLRGHDDVVVGASFSPDGARVVTASSDNTARIWDARTTDEIVVLRGHNGPVSSAGFSPDGAQVVTASQDRTARIWNAKAARVAVLNGHEDSITGVVFSPDGRRIVTAPDDKTARIWDVKTLRETAVLRGHDGQVWGAAFSPDGAYVVTASDDKTARIWDATTARQLAVLAGHGDDVESAAFSPDGTCIVTASDDKTARIWD